MTKQNLDIDPEKEYVLHDFLCKESIKIGDTVAGIIERRIQIIINRKPDDLTEEQWHAMVGKVIGARYFPVIARQP